jgi:hypothetical protein
MTYTRKAPVHVSLELTRKHWHGKRCRRLGARISSTVNYYAAFMAAATLSDTVVLPVPRLVGVSGRVVHRHQEFGRVNVMY